MVILCLAVTPSVTQYMYIKIETLCFVPEVINIVINPQTNNFYQDDDEKIKRKLRADLVLSFMF